MSEDVTQLLQRYGKGDRGAFDQLMPIIYAELKRIARAAMSSERAEHTLQPTALVHEAFFRLAGQQNMAWHDRKHFLAIAAQMMRRVLVDHARAKRAEKRGGNDVRIAVEDVEIAAQERPIADVVALDTALTKLAELNERQAKIVELRYFAVLSLEETA